MVHTVWAQSGEGYDPQNPGDPDVYYSLDVEASPKSGGSISPSTRQKLSPGKEVYCSANAKTGYKFKNWMIGDSLVSSNSSMYFTMPEHDVVLTAHFDWVGNDDYNPQNPGDPFADGYQHKVTLYATPSVGGYFNSSSFYLREGESTNVYAYPRDGYRFVSWKQNGTIVSTSNPMQIKMGSVNLEYTAQFVYDPENPGNPSPNSFNSATGELVIDEFITGDLNRAISSAIGGSDNYHLVQSIKIIGRMNSYDFGFSYRLSNCSLIDLARTTGYTEIPRWSFENLSALTKIVLPFSVERICYNAFSGCSSLSEIVCYATVPPVLESGAFNNVPSGLIVRVPSSSLSLYTMTDGWKDFTILPLDEETCSISISLPPDAGDGRYKNMTLELDNISSGQILKYLITERTIYTFANLVRDTKYNIFVKNASGSILGSIQDVEVADKDINVSFTKLLQPRNVVLNVLANHETVTDQVTVSWTDIDGKYLGQGNILSGILEGSKIVYQISLPQSLGSEYIIPTNTEYTVANTTNNVICTLQPFDKVQATGCVKDLTTNSAIQNATITLSQRLNGKYSKSQTLKTDSEGKFVATIFNAPLTATIAANNYISQTVEINDASTLGTLNEVFLKDITGTVITTNFTYQESVVEGEAPEALNYYSDYANVAYTIFNTTTGKEIKDFNVQYPTIVLLEEVTEGDRLKIVASSKNNAFVDVVAEGNVDSQNQVDVTFPIIQLGGIELYTYSIHNSDNVGVIYDSNGKFVRKENYTGSSLKIADIQDGDYTIVSMGNSKFFNTMLSISDLSNSGLEKNKDYVLSTVTIESGIIKNVIVEEIPYFDESKFYYTGVNTLFATNKSSVTVGNYITLHASVDFKEKYVNSISDVKLIFDLPENCNFVENSVLSGKGMGSYSVENNHICVDLPSLDDQVRFCVVPTIGTTYRPSAYVHFSIEGKDVLQPIGNVCFEANNLSINIPNEITDSEIIKINGVAPSNAKVSVFDYGTKIAETYSLANGQWEISYDIAQGKSYNSHSLYANVVSPDGLSLNTNVKKLVYSKGAMNVKTVTMINGSNNVLFDFEAKNSKTISYSFNPSINDFTFVVNFSNNSDSLLSNVSIDVHTTNGDVIEIPATYSSSKNRWIGMSNLFSSSSLPQSINVTYDYWDFSLINDKTKFADFIKDRLDNVILIEKKIISPNAETYKFRDNIKGDTIIYSSYKLESSRLENIQEQLVADGWEIVLQCNDCTHLKQNNSSIVLYQNGDSIMIVGAYILKENIENPHPQTRAIIVGDDGIHIQHTGNALQESWDRFIIERYDYPLRLANCKIKCNSDSYDPEVEHLKSSVRHLISLQPAKLFGFLGNTANLGSAAIGTPSSKIEAVYQAYQSADAATHMLDGMSNIMDCERQYLRDILAFPDYCQCNKRPMSSRRASQSRSVEGERKCRKGDKEDKSKDNVNPTIDPSGYVYEGVSSNRLEGVTATAYYKEQVEDMYGDLHDNIVKWDAEEYAQENPLFTDENGMYAWDVPQGMWQVKFEKEGYETTYSEWLPVPPPQLDVNVAMTQVRQPEVKAVHAYKNGVEIEFDKYMLPETLTPDNIYVTANGVNVEGEVAMLNEEVSYEGEGTKYASKVRFNPTKALTGSVLTLTIANKVKSYAGIQMADNFTQSFDIEKEVKSIMADSLVKVPYQGSKVITLYVQPADAAVGKTMHADISSEMIASLTQKDVIIAENGIAQFEINGELPGTTGITFSIDGVKATTTVIANVGDFETSLVNEPKASLVSGSSVYRGTTVKLTADSKDLKIWYTTDGTCPCDENGSRKQYTEPIAINSDVTIKSMAENAYGDASDVATFIYSILQSKTGVSLNNGWNWVSFNMKNDALSSVNTALTSGSWTSDDVVKDNKYVDMYSANQKQWIGTLSKHGALNNTQMYKVRSSKAQTLGLTGEAVHPTETTITLGAGWNYISYLPLVNMNVSDALKGYKAENGDVIKSQDAFATYSTTNGWEGDLTTLTVGRGYMLKRGANASQVSFTYPVESPGSSVKAPASAKSYRYADNMNIIGEVEGISVEDGDSLVAYVNGEMRGASRLERNHKVFLTIQGDEEAQMAIVLVRDGEIVATANNMIGYQSNNVLGTSDAPTAITFITDDRNLDGTIGNVKAIYSINGIKMNTRHLNNIPSGTYIIYSEKNGNTCVTKFIK